MSDTERDWWMTELAQVRAERDALAAQVAAVEALAVRWRHPDRAQNAVANELLAVIERARQNRAPTCD